MQIFDCAYNNLKHDWESVGNTERIDNTTVAVEYQCLNCGKTDFQYYEDLEQEGEDY